MGLADRVRDQKPAGATRRQGAKSPGGARRPGVKIARATLHLGEETVKRLGVHCSLEGVNNSREADRILLQWLKAHGKGKLIFDSPEGRSDASGVDDDDRLEPGLQINPDVAESAA